ncbi:hypothetical protein [Sporolactobacillus putidus]|uniref:Lipoprotein n=1 Tax=Sporolactobacillus putidus TaxID=492735 RepID=A0A917S1M5_9BACL|nr:hypothetical protein [Sporolactobacillus putidus]GGL48875.1 hypothetical protein GCM10007968_11280 [Sporolactobacillus putidus]
MKKIITAVLLMTLLLSACGSQGSAAYNQAMKEGFDAVTAGNYDQAVTAFEKALADKKADRRATALLEETRVLKSAEESLNKGNWNKAIYSADTVINQTNVDQTVLTKAQTIKNEALKEKQGQAAQNRASQPAADGSSGSDSGSSVQGDGQTAGNSGQPGSSGSSTVSGSSQSGSTVQQATQKEAEMAVVKAAGYSLDQVYTDTTDNGAYYSIELRENHKNDSAADPNTAPAIGFFRYYKATGKIAQLDLISNQYKDIK